MNEPVKLPPITQQPLLHVDGTPNTHYPLRILRAYRDNCDCRWVTDNLPEGSRQLHEAMNEHQEQRARLLDKAIGILSKEIVVDPRTFAARMKAEDEERGIPNAP